MFLLDSNRFTEKPESAVDEILGILEKAGATVVVHRPWQEGRLTYPINGHQKGLYYLTFFRMEGTGVSQIARACKLTDLVLRHMVISHPAILFDAMVTAIGGDNASPADGKDGPADGKDGPADGKDGPVDDLTGDDKIGSENDPSDSIKGIKQQEGTEMASEPVS